MATILAVDQYSRHVASMFNEADFVSESTVFQNFFGRPEHNSETVYSPNSQIVDIDIRRSTDTIAATLTRGAYARNISKKTNQSGNWTTQSRVYPLIEEKGSITASQLNSRVFGEGIYQGREKIDRLRDYAVHLHTEGMRKIIRTFEYMAGQSLLTGKMPAMIGTTDTSLMYDFKRNSDNTFTPAIAWDQATAKPIDDLETLAKRILVNGKKKPNFILMSEDVWPKFLENTQVKELTNKLYYSLVMVSAANPVPRELQPIVDGGAVCRGLITTPNGFQFWAFSYIATYTDPDGEVQDYFPAGTVLMGYYGARCDRYFGPSEFLPVNAVETMWYNNMFGFNMDAPPMPPMVQNASAVISPLMFYHRAEAPDLKNISLYTQSAPIFATTHTDAFGTLTSVLSTSE